MAKTSFWEESYKRPGKLDTFGGGKPSANVIAAASLLSDRLRSGAAALDLGCGEGRNAIYLAGLGFRTYASDISEAGIEKLNTVARDRGLDIETCVCDMREYCFPCPFDLVVFQGCLHFIERRDQRILLARLKASTTDGGVHVVGVFTDTVPEPEDQRGLMVGLTKEGELLGHYRDWEVLESDSIVIPEHEHPGGVRHSHSANRVTARKPQT